MVVSALGWSLVWKRTTKCGVSSECDHKSDTESGQKVTKRKRKERKKNKEKVIFNWFYHI